MIDSLFEKLGAIVTAGALVFMPACAPKPTAVPDVQEEAPAQQTTDQAEAAAPSAPEQKYTYEGQAIGIKTAHNIRQLGGYIGKDGRKVKNNVLIRAGLLSWLSEKDANTLANKYNVKYIVDLRSENEAESNKDVDIPGSKYLFYPVYSSDIYDQETKNILGEIDDATSDPVQADIAYAKRGIISKKFEGMLTSKHAQEMFSSFFDVLLEAGDGEAVIWHCSKGKDRTGMASALLLYALGVDEETIVQDFMFTNDAYKEKIDKDIQTAKENGLTEEETKKYIGAANGVNSDDLINAFNKVKQEYGSVHNYLNQAIGLTDSEIELLQSKYLE